MRILWFTWKDTRHPLSGGAELMNEELAERAVKDSHEVIFIVGGYQGCQPHEIRNGVRYIRIGNKVSIYMKAAIYYLKNLKEWPDVVIEEINTIPFFTNLYVKQKRVLFIYQLAREIWFHEISQPISTIGYLLEPMYLRLLSKEPSFTESESTRKDLARYGFNEKKISIIPVGNSIEPLQKLSDVVKFDQFTILSVGTIRSMKRTHHQIGAFEVLKKTVKKARLIIAGKPYGAYGKKVQDMIRSSQYHNDIEYKGVISEKEKRELMQKSHVIVVTSLKEGWGLIVTEANSQGTPAVVYNVDGLRDAVKNNVTGLITKENTPASLAQSIESLCNNETTYRSLQKNAFLWSKELNFNNSYKVFISKIKDLV